MASKPTGRFRFNHLPDIDATTSAGPMVLKMMASAAGFEPRRIRERPREAAARPCSARRGWSPLEFCRAHAN
jgi:DNA invertase Pin-like site-specific DNA recombinase